MALHDQNEAGLQLYAAIAGMGGSSTRAEIAAGIIAMAANEVVHMGTDSQSFMNRANGILQNIKDNNKPKRPWSIQKDGDLWETFCKMATRKGTMSVNISKVKKGMRLTKMSKKALIRRKTSLEMIWLTMRRTKG